LSNKPLQPGDRVGDNILHEVMREGAFVQAAVGRVLPAIVASM
jgi:hypothetical protein